MRICICDKWRRGWCIVVRPFSKFLDQPLQQRVCILYRNTRQSSTNDRKPLIARKLQNRLAFVHFLVFWQKYQVNLTVCHFISAASYGEAEVLFLIGFSFPLRLQTFTDFYSIFLDVSHCPARDISVLLSKFYCICHVTNSTCSAAWLLPLLVFSPGTVFWTLSTTQTPPKLLSCAC